MFENKEQPNYIFLSLEKKRHMSSVNRNLPHKQHGVGYEQLIKVKNLLYLIYVSVGVESHFKEDMRWPSNPFNLFFPLTLQKCVSYHASNKHYNYTIKVGFTELVYNRQTQKLKLRVFLS